MDVGALLLILAIVVITLSYVLKPLRSQSIDQEKVIDYWVDQASIRNIDEEKPTQTYCPNCGEPVHSSDRFCSSCGIKLEAK